MCSIALRIGTVQLQQPDSRTLPDQPTTLSQKSHQLIVPVFSGTRRQLAQQCRLLVLHGLDVIDLKHSRCSIDTPTPVMCHGPQRVRCWPRITVPAAADDELPSPALVCTATGLTRLGLCVVGKQSCVSCSQQFPVTPLTTQCTPILQHQSLHPIQLPHLKRVVVRLPWSSYLCLRLLCLQTAVVALAAPHVAFLAGFPCRTRVTRFETAVMT